MIFKLAMGRLAACAMRIVYVCVALAATPAYALDNPLKSEFQTIPGFIKGVLEVFVMVALPIVALFIVYAGFRFISARGNENKLTDAKNNFMFIILGSLLILGAWLIANLIQGTVSQLTG